MNLSRRQSFTAAITLVVLVLSIQPALAENFVVSGAVEPPSAGPGETVNLKVDFKLAEGIHIYKDKLAFSWEKLEGVTPGQPMLPPAGTIPDPLDETGQTITEVYEKAVTVSLPFTVTAAAGSTATIRGAVKYQGCTDTVCFRPMREVLSFDIPVIQAAGVTGVEETPPASVTARSQAQAPAPPEPVRTVTGKEFLLRLLMAFGFGILISLTPCVYPMIPITAAIVGGRQQQGEGSLGTALVRSVVYVFGLAIVYATIGVLSASLGGAFSRWLKTAWVLVPVAAIFVLLALSMFEVFTIQMPSFITSRVRGRRSGKTVGDVFLLRVPGQVVHDTPYT